MADYVWALVLNERMEGIPRVFYSKRFMVDYVSAWKSRVFCTEKIFNVLPSGAAFVTNVFGQLEEHRY